MRLVLFLALCLCQATRADVRSESRRIFEEAIRAGRDSAPVYINAAGLLTLEPVDPSTQVGTLQRASAGAPFEFTARPNPFARSGLGMWGLNYEHFANMHGALAEGAIHHWNRHTLATQFPAAGGTAYVWLDERGRIRHIGTSASAPSVPADMRLVVSYDPARGFTLNEGGSLSTEMGWHESVTPGLRIPADASATGRATTFPPLPGRRDPHLEVIRANEQLFHALRASGSESQRVWYRIGDGRLTTEAPANLNDYFTGQINRLPGNRLQFVPDAPSGTDTHPLMASTRTAAVNFVQQSLIAQHNREFAARNFVGVRRNPWVWADPHGRFVSMANLASVAPHPGLILRPVYLEESYGRGRIPYLAEYYVERQSSAAPPVAPARPAAPVIPPPVGPPTGVVPAGVAPTNPFAGMQQPYQRQTSNSYWRDFRDYLRNPLNHPGTIIGISGRVGMGLQMAAITEGYKIIGARLERMAEQDRRLLFECNRDQMRVALQEWQRRRNLDLTCGASDAGGPRVAEYIHNVGEANWASYVSLMRELSPTPPERSAENLLEAGRFMEQMHFMEQYHRLNPTPPCRFVDFDTRNFGGTNTLPRVQSLINFGVIPSVVYDYATQRYSPLTRARLEARTGPAINWPADERPRAVTETGVNRELACVTDDQRTCFINLGYVQRGAQYLTDAQRQCEATGTHPDFHEIDRLLTTYQSSSRSMRGSCPQLEPTRREAVALVQRVLDAGFPAAVWEGNLNDQQTLARLTAWCHSARRAEPRPHATDGGGGPGRDH